MSQLAATCYNLSETNNGKYKSEKQKAFLLANSVDGMITNSGRTFKTQWIEYFLLDEEGVYEIQRSSQTKGLRTLWKRGEKTANQKAAEKHKKALAIHLEKEKEVQAIFEERCLVKYGFVIDAKKIDDLYYAAQRVSSLMNVIPREVFLSDQEQAMVMIDEFAKAKPMLEEYQVMIREMMDFMSEFRVYVLEHHKSKFQYSFLSTCE